jgi:hypothetical protein
VSILSGIAHRFPQPTREMLGDFARGPLTLLPGVVILIIIQVYSALGQWESGRALALSLGFTVGVLATSGFVPAISRRVSIYQSLNNLGAAVRFLRVGTAVANVCVAGITLLAVLAMTELNIFNPNDRLVFGLACVGLGSIWLMSIWLLLAGVTGWLGVGLGAGLVAGIVADRIVALFAGNHLAFGTAIGYLVAIGSLWLIANRLLQRRSGKQAGALVLPSVAYMTYEVSPFFAYGVLYMLLVLLPHLFGWLGAQRDAQPLWALSSLEVGLMLSMPPTMLAAGVAEHTLRLFWRHAEKAQHDTPSDDLRRFGSNLTRFFYRRLAVYLFALAIVSLVAYALFRVVLGTGVLAGWVSPSYIDALQFIFLAGLVGYFFLAWGVFNCMFNLTLAQPGGATRSVCIAIVALAVTGIPLALSLNFKFVVLASVIGAVVFVLASLRSTLQMLKSAEYHYYTSF